MSWPKTSGTSPWKRPGTAACWYNLSRQSTYFEPGQTPQTGTAAYPRKMSTNGRCRFFLRTRSTVSPSSTAASRLRTPSCCNPPCCHTVLALNICTALCACGRQTHSSRVALGAMQRPSLWCQPHNPSASNALTLGGARVVRPGRAGPN